MAVVFAAAASDEKKKVNDSAGHNEWNGGTSCVVIETSVVDVLQKPGNKLLTTCH